MKTKIAPSKPLGEKQLSQNRLYYIAEAGLEYLISLLITDAFLAKLLPKFYLQHLEQELLLDFLQKQRKLQKRLHT